MARGITAVSLSVASYVGSSGCRTLQRTTFGSVEREFRKRLVQCSPLGMLIYRTRVTLSPSYLRATARTS